MPAFPFAPGEAIRALTEADATLGQLIDEVGPFTLELHMLLIFRLGRPDVLPATDLGVRKGFMRTYDRPALPTPAELMAYGTRWHPYRSVASWYLWRALELP